MSVYEEIKSQRERCRNNAPHELFHCSICTEPGGKQELTSMIKTDFIEISNEESEIASFAAVREDNQTVLEILFFALDFFV